MSRWFRFYDTVLDDPKVQRLPPALFKDALVAAMAGQESPFSGYLRRGSDRPSAAVWAKLRAEVFARDNYACAYCGERGGRLECDHIEPVALGGSSAVENLTTACFKCNRSKRAKRREDWRQ